MVVLSLDSYVVSSYLWRNTGFTKKKDDTHRMADANKAFSHFRW